MTKLYTLVLKKNGKEIVYMTDTRPNVLSRKRQLETSQRGINQVYLIREASEDEEKYRKPPCMNFDPSGDAGSRKHIRRKANVRKIKQKNPTKKDHHPMDPEEVNAPPEHFRYSGTSRGEAETMREHIETWDEVAACVVVCDGVYYTVYAD